MRISDWSSDVCSSDLEWISPTPPDLRGRAAQLDAVLTRHGLNPRGDCPLFRLVETANAPELFTELTRHRILTRPFANHPHLLRLGLPADDAALARLDGALAEALADG